MKNLLICLGILWSTSSFAVQVLRLEYTQTSQTTDQDGKATSMSMDYTWFYSSKSAVLYTRNQVMTDKNGQQRQGLPTSRMIMNLDGTSDDWMVSTMPISKDGSQTTTTCTKLSAPPKPKDPKSADTMQITASQGSAPARTIAGLPSEEYTMEMDDQSRGIRMVSDSWMSFTDKGKLMSEFWENYAKIRGAAGPHSSIPKPVFPESLKERAKNGVIQTMIDANTVNSKRAGVKMHMNMQLTKWAMQDLDPKYFQLPKCDRTIDIDKVSSLVSNPFGTAPGPSASPWPRLKTPDYGSAIKKAMPANPAGTSKTGNAVNGLIKGIF